MDAFQTAGTSPPEPEYLTVVQVAGLLQVDEKTVYRWTKADPSMPVLRVGGVVRFPRERLLRWLRDLEQGAGRPRRIDSQVRSGANSPSPQEAA